MNELEWLTDHRPEVEDDELARARARRALLEHADPPPARRRRGSAWRPRLAFVSVAALTAAGMAIAWPTDGPSPTPVIGPPQEAVAAPLVRLSQKIAQAPEPKGDATLVHRSHHFPDGRDFTGNDLYLDDGRYFYGATKAELKASALHNDINDDLLAAAAKSDREGVIDATWGGKRPKEDAAPPAVSAEQEAILKAKRAVGPAPTPASPRTIDDNRVWFGSMDALLAGAGRPDVRAGVMKLLAEMPKVKVTETAETLTLTQTDFSDGYEETLVVDAKTGVPVKFFGGTHGKRPDVVVDYEIKRVTAANWADAAA